MNEKGIGVAIGVILMVVMTVAIAVTVYVYVSNMLSDETEYDIHINGNLTYMQIEYTFDAYGNRNYYYDLSFNNSNIIYAINPVDIDFKIGTSYNLYLKESDNGYYDVVRYIVEVR